MKQIIIQNTKAPVIDIQGYPPEFMDEGHIDLRTPEQKHNDLAAKVDDLSNLVLKLHALTDQLHDIVANQQVATSSVKGDN